MFLKPLLAGSIALAAASVFAAPAQQPALERAQNLEHSGQFELAREIYSESAASSNPGDKRAALLGLARVARAQSQLSQARGIYAQILAEDPADPEAKNGMAWVLLADYDVAQARQGFGQTLEAHPHNAEALAGLAQSDNVFRYQLDAKGSYLRNDVGKLWGGSLGFSTAIDARQVLDVDLRRNSVDVGPLDRPTDSRLLPSTSVAVGYRWQVPSYYSIRLSAEHIERDDTATQRRLGVEGEYQITEGLLLSGGLRQSFGSGWRSQLRHLGLGIGLGAGWQAVVRLYSEHNIDQDSHRRALALEAVRQGPGHMLWVLGTSHGTSPNATDVYGRAVLPIGQQGAILATIRHLSLNRETQVELGWRKYWN
ncbi:tetratricopeptide repeat protein [Comamonas sp. MYb21]|uniref:tetratricopeptide repeat protein n=1 Tax=Comamonas sp. MYb21 TaxID=1848648 RepID=UPI00309D6E1F